MSARPPDAGTGERAVPYLCPFCGEEDLRPVEHGRWSCLSCLRVFSVAFHGLARPTSVSTSGTSTSASSTPGGSR